MNSGILAGPTMDLDGPVTVFRWIGGAVAPKEECVVPTDELEHVVDVPYGRGVDHAEGMTLFSTDESAPRSLLIVYDSASESRQLKENSVAADLLQIPKTSRLKKA